MRKTLINQSLIDQVTSLQKIQAIEYIASFDGKTLYTETYCRVKKPHHTHLVLHGLGINSQNTLLLVTEIMNQFPQDQVIIYDLRGHGLSTNLYPPHPECPTLEYYGARDLQAVLDHFHLKSGTIWGHSYGGIIIQSWLEILHPSDAYTIVLANSYPYLNGFVVFSRRFWLKILQHFNSKRSSQPKISLAENYEYVQTWDVSFNRMWHMGIRTLGLRNFLLTYLSLLGWHLKQPTLIDQSNVILMCGTDDFLRNMTTNKQVLQNLKQATLENFPCNHHQILLTHFKELVTTYKQFIQK